MPTLRIRSPLSCRLGQGQKQVSRPIQHGTDHLPSLALATNNAKGHKDSKQTRARAPLRCGVHLTLQSTPEPTVELFSLAREPVASTSCQLMWPKSIAASLEAQPLRAKGWRSLSEWETSCSKPGRRAPGWSPGVSLRRPSPVWCLAMLRRAAPSSEE